MNKVTQQIAVTAAGAIATGLVIYWFINRGSEVVAKAAEKVNPASPNNFVYSDIIGGLGRALTGDDNYDFGSHLYDMSTDPSWSLWGKDNGKLNPASPNNIPYKATNYLGAKVTGKESFDLGIWWYDFINSDKATGTDANKRVYQDQPTLPTRIVTESLNPASHKNIVYRGLNSLGSIVTNREDYDFGAWLYDITR